MGCELEAVSILEFGMKTTESFQDTEIRSVFRIQTGHFSQDTFPLTPVQLCHGEPHDLGLHGSNRVEKDKNSNSLHLLLTTALSTQKIRQGILCRSSHCRKRDLFHLRHIDATVGT